MAGSMQGPSPTSFQSYNQHTYWRREIGATYTSNGILCILHMFWHNGGSLNQRTRKYGLDFQHVDYWNQVVYYPFQFSCNFLASTQLIHHFLRQDPASCVLSLHCVESSMEISRALVTSSFQEEYWSWLLPSGIMPWLYQPSLQFFT